MRRAPVTIVLVAILVVALAASIYYLRVSGTPISTPTTTSEPSASVSTGTSAPVNSTIPVGVIWYLWYGNATTGAGGLESPGWNATSCPGGGAVVDRPNLGYYVSDSNQTFETQIGEMHSAGISFAIVSWWGPFTQGQAGAVNKAMHDLFSYLKSTNSSFKVAVMVDAFPGTCNPPLPSVPMSQVYDYVYSNFAAPYKQWYFNWEGRPLLMTFNPVEPLYNDTRFTSKLIGNYACEPVNTCPNHGLDQALDWVWWEAPAQYFEGQAGSLNATNDEGQPVISADGEVTLVPRIDSYFDRGYQNGSYLRFDANLSEGLYGEEWNYVLSHKSSVRLVIIYSWNEFHERTAIEPHIDWNEALPEDYLLNVTAGYVRMYE